VPIAHIYVTDASPEHGRRLLLEGGLRYAAVLGAPIDRIRIVLHRLPPADVAVAGAVVAESETHAPFFTALVLAGRPVEQRHQIIAELTDLLVEVLGVDRSTVRGLVTEVDADGWGIGGVPASVVRRDEIRARATAPE
jgi:4-oxalocrotonate tautomerase family enzyme